VQMLPRSRVRRFTSTFKDKEHFVVKAQH
jgi:hypothetical protein